MSKRFTDTEKWNKPWYRKLPLKYKLLWEYIYTKCDKVGVWDVDLELASFFIGEPFELEDSKKYLGKQIKEIDGGAKWLLTDFVDFQYGELTPTNNFHRSLIAAVGRIPKDSNSGAAEGLPSPIRRIRVREEEDKKKKEGGMEGVKPYPLPDPKTNPAACLVLSFKTRKGLKFDDRAWDEANFGRSMKAAKVLLSLCGDLQTSEQCLHDMTTEYDEKGLSWTLETIARNASDWLRTNGRTDANASRAGLRMAIARRKTEGTGQGGVVAASDGSLPVAVRDRPDPENGDQEDGEGHGGGQHDPDMD